MRLTEANAKILYDWADIGTYVLIAYDKNEFTNLEEDKATIKTYYNLINAGKYKEALLLKVIKPDSLQTFIDTYHGLTVRVEDIIHTSG